MAKMRVLKPEMDEIRAKFPEDMQAQQQEQMKLYSQVGVNPLSGCIPILLQMPVFLAMFNFFPNAIQLRQKGFLWADDLSSYDSVLDLPFSIPFYGDHVSMFCLLMTISQLIYTYYNNQLNPTANQGPVNMQAIAYTTPVIFLFFLNSFSSGLTYYYFVSNLITVGQQLLIKGFIDEGKIRRILDENKKKNEGKGKSKFQQRLEDYMKSQDQKPNNKPDNKGKGKKK
jgi:YidC/Oxa1 family membrane protein insertase